MSKNFKKITRWVTGAMAIVFGFFIQIAPSVMAATGNALTVSPMYQSIIVNPGESQKVSFQVSNPAEAKQDMNYELSVEPFYVNEQNEVTYKAENNHSEITSWVTFDVPTEGKIEPNGDKEIIFTVNVPNSAPAGGQYFSVMVTEKNEDDATKDDSRVSSDSRGASVKETWRVAHLVYVEVTGDVTRRGEITDASVPSFLLGGSISGSSLVKNLGNVHGEAKYTLQVYPLFSSEEIYTNEEKPATRTILPDRQLYTTTSWDETPAIGIFNVVYTVEFEDATAQVSKMVIICPIWLLFLILFVIIAIIFWIILRVKNKNKSKNQE